MIDYTIRPARMDERDALQLLIALSARNLSKEYTAQEIESAITYLYGIDSELVEDNTYFVAMHEREYLACGGWSRRRNLFGGDQYANRASSSLLDPATEPAKIRAFFVHPTNARRGIAAALLKHCENEATAYGFSAIEMMATLPGIKLYESFGYRCDPSPSVFPLPDGTAFRMVRMYKRL